MSPEVERVLREATVRPWHVTTAPRDETKFVVYGPDGMYVGRTMKPRDVAKLLEVAVNSYEAREALVGRLVGALREGCSALRDYRLSSQPNEEHAMRAQVLMDAALAEAEAADATRKGNREGEGQ